MAVAYSSTVPAVTHANASSIASSNWLISGANGAIVVEISYVSTIITVASVVWSLGSGTAVQVVLVRGGVGPANTSAIWAIPAPTTGTGTITVTLSSAVDFVFNADFFTDADQTTPCPSGDAVTDVTATGSVTLTPTNLTANDATAGLGSGTTTVTSASPNQTALTNAPGQGFVCGYATGTTGLTTVISGATNDRSRAAVRIAAFAAGGGGPTLPWLPRVTNLQGDQGAIMIPSGFIPPSKV